MRLTELSLRSALSVSVVAKFRSLSAFSSGVDAMSMARACIEAVFLIISKSSVFSGGAASGGGCQVAK